VQEIHPELLSTGNEYVLKIEITQNDATVVESWHIALVTDKIAEKAGVELTVKIAGLQGTKWIEAIVVDLGSPAVDGCGWAINIDNITYIPDNLDEQYKQNRLKVMIVYENTSQIYQCPGFSEINYDKIIIKQIMKIET
jgi:hypothetical protein